MNDASGFIQSIRGPIMLIALGSLVAIDYAGIYGFWRTWPVLLIVFGVLKLLERASARPIREVSSSGENPGGHPPGGNVI
jgi:hypothetical protein